MDVISVAMELKAMSMDDLVKGKDVYEEEERPKDRTLGDTMSGRGCGRLVRAQSDKLLSVGEVGPEPMEGYVCDTKS